MAILPIQVNNLWVDLGMNGESRKENPNQKGMR